MGRQDKEARGDLSLNLGVSLPSQLPSARIRVSPGLCQCVVPSHEPAASPQISTLAAPELTVSVAFNCS